MSRKHARLLVSIWDDPDWLRLPTAQQITYLALLSSRDLSWCGVAPLLPQRLVRLASDLTERKVKAALDALDAARFLVIDESTAEVAVRSYVRHDDLLKQPNVVKAMVTALSKVHSEMLRRSVVTELRRQFKDEPDLKGWKTIEAMDAELFQELSTNPYRKAS